MTKSKPYVLKRYTNNEVLFSAAYAKHYFEGYCALSENYPALNTRVLLCRNIGGVDKKYGENLSVLIRQYPGAEDAIIGYFVILCETESEQDATQAMKKNIAGRAAFRSIMEQTE